MEDEKEKKLHDLKIIFRALLISQGKTDTTVRKLAGLYKEEEGSYPKHWEYGHETLVDLLNSLKDTCYLRKNRLGELCVYPIDSEKTAHISSLVARQKSNKSRKSKSTCTYRGRNFFLQQQQRYMRKSTVYPLPNPIMSSHVLQAMLDLRNSLAHSRTHGLRKGDVLARVKSNLGERASNYHIHNLNFHLNELSHVVTVKDDSIYFKEDLANQTLPKRPNNLIHVPLNSVHTQLTPKPLISKPVNPVVNGFIQQSSSMFKPLSSIVDEPAGSKVNKPSVLLPASNAILNGLKSSGRPLLKTSDFKSQFAQESSLTNGVLDNDKPKTSESHSASGLIKERVKFRLEKLIENHPEGIWCSELPGAYKKEYDLDLDYNDLGFNSIIEFVAALPEVFTIVEPGDSKKLMILSARKQNLKDGGVNDNHQRRTTAALYNFEDVEEDIDPIPLKLSQKVSESLIPDGYMSLDETVDQIQVSSIVSNIDDDYFEAMVSEIFTPSFFWIKLRQNKKKFNLLMDRLEDFYGNYKDLKPLKIPQCILQPGLNVACIYSHMWHRAVVKKVKPDGFVVIFFYDYGTVKSYNPNELYFLNKSFSSMPAQAIACGLHYVRPIGSNEWPKCSTNAFIDKVWDLPLIASIGALNEDNNTMMLSLTDTTDELFDVHINDWMVENKYAEWGKMDKNNKIPLHKICSYDEVDLLRIRDEERNYPQVGFKNNLPNTTLIDTERNEESSKMIDYILTNCNTNYNETPMEESNIISIVRENANLMTRSDKMLQSINLNETVKDQVTDRSISVKSEAMIKSLARIENGKFTVASHQDSKSTKTNTSGMNSSNEYSENKYVHTKEILDSQFKRRSSTFSSVSQQIDDNKSERPIQINEHHKFTKGEPTTNGFSDQDSYVNSTYSNSADESINQAYQKIKRIDDQKNFVNSNNSKSNGLISDKEVDCIERRLSLQTLTNSDVNSDYFDHPSYFMTILSEKMGRKPLHIFHYENQGWICLTEFISVFTVYKDSRVLFKLLKFLKYSLSVKEVSRGMEPQLFSELDKSELNVPREDNKIKSDFVLTLMSLKDMLKVLEKLRKVSSNEISEGAPFIKYFKEKAESMLYAKYNNKIIYDVLNVILKYKEFKKSMKQRNQL